MVQTAQDAVRAVTDVGRLIWGSVWEKQTTGYNGVPYEAGKEPIQFGIAILKTSPKIPDLLGLLYNTAMAGYPNNPHIAQKINNEWQSGFTADGFKFKIRDGDRPNKETGVINPNAAGCFIFNMSTTLPIKCCNAMNQEIDPKTIKRGYFVDVAISAKANGLTDTNSGIYINPNVVRLIAFGEEIIGGVSIEEAFKNHAAPTQLPPGASLTPLAPAGGMPGFTSQGQPIQQQPGGYPQPQQQMPPAGQVSYQQPGQTQYPAQQQQPQQQMPPANPYGYPQQQMPPQGGQPAPGGYPQQQMPPANPYGYQQPQGNPAQYPQGGPGAGFPGNPQGGPPQQQNYGAPPNNYPAPGSTTGFPSNQGMPAGFQPGGNQPPPNGNYQTGYPINPATGQPIMPHQQFLNPPR